MLRIPTSIPDDEMLFDRLRMTDAEQLGGVWREIMRRVYDAGGIYVLNLHPERGILAREALDALLRSSRQQALPIWVARLNEVATWWRERAATALEITETGAGRWHAQVSGSLRATLLARNGTVEGADTTPWPCGDVRIRGRAFDFVSPSYPGVSLSRRSPADVEQMLREQGYPVMRVESEEQAHSGAYVDCPDGLGATRAERQQTASALVRAIEQGETPLVRLGLWPDGQRAALSITGDVDSVTIQDFFLRILEVRKYASA